MEPDCKRGVTYLDMRPEFKFGLTDIIERELSEREVR